MSRRRLGGLLEVEGQRRWALLGCGEGCRLWEKERVVSGGVRCGMND